MKTVGQLTHFLEQTIFNLGLGNDDIKIIVETTELFRIVRKSNVNRLRHVTTDVNKVVSWLWGYHNAKADFSK